MIDSQDVSEQELEVLSGDVMINNLYRSKQIVNTLTFLCEIDKNGWTKELEDQLCTLRDLSTKREVVSHLMFHDFPKIAKKALVITNEPRLTEIILGIIGNLCSSDKVCDMIGRDRELVTQILSCSESNDSLILIQLIRILKLVMEHIGENHQSNWIGTSVSDIPPDAYEKLQEIGLLDDDPDLDDSLHQSRPAKRPKRHLPVKEPEKGPSGNPGPTTATKIQAATLRRLTAIDERLARIENAQQEEITKARKDRADIQKSLAQLKTATQDFSNRIGVAETRIRALQEARRDAAIAAIQITQSTSTPHTETPHREDVAAPKPALRGGLGMRFI